MNHFPLFKMLNLNLKLGQQEGIEVAVYVAERLVSVQKTFVSVLNVTRKPPATGTADRFGNLLVIVSFEISTTRVGLQQDCQFCHKNVL